MGEDAITLAAYVASHRTQSRPAARQQAMESGRTDSTTGLASAGLQQSEASGTTELVHPVAEANPKAGPRGGSTT